MAHLFWSQEEQVHAIIVIIIWKVAPHTQLNQDPCWAWSLIAKTINHYNLIHNNIQNKPAKMKPRLVGVAGQAMVDDNKQTEH